MSAADLASGTDRALKHMREVLDRMLELESYNEVIEKLRGVIEIQEQIVLVIFDPLNFSEVTVLELGVKEYGLFVNIVNVERLGRIL